MDMEPADEHSSISWLGIFFVSVHVFLLSSAKPWFCQTFEILQHLSKNSKLWVADSKEGLGGSKTCNQEFYKEL